MDKDGIALDLNSGNALEVLRNLQHEDHVPRFLPALRRQPLRQTSVTQFRTYEVSLQSGEVRKAGVKIRVQQQPMKLLKILLERPGEVVTREELRGRVWADESFGDFDQAVNIAVGKLRSALGDSAENRDISRLFQNVAIASLLRCRLSQKATAPKSQHLRLELSLGQAPGISSKARG